MVTHTTDTILDKNTHNLNTLLKQLEEMKDAPASERLQFIQEGALSILEKNKDFDWGGAYDTSRVPFQERGRQIEELNKDWKCLNTSWSESPLPEHWKDAGAKLLEHLASLIHGAQNEWREDEISQLSSIWDTAPDITKEFNDCTLTAWGASEPYSRTRARNHNKEVRQSDAVQQLQSVVDDIKDEILPKEEQTSDLDALFQIYQKGNLSMDAIKNLVVEIMEKRSQETELEKEEQKLEPPTSESVAKLKDVPKEEVPEVVEPPKVEEPIKAEEAPVQPDAFYKKRVSDLASEPVLDAPRISHTIVDDENAAKLLTKDLGRHKIGDKQYPIKNMDEDPEPAPLEGVVKKVGDPHDRSSAVQELMPKNFQMSLRMWTDAICDATCDVWTYAGGGSSIYRGYDGNQCLSFVWKNGRYKKGTLTDQSTANESIRLDIADVGDGRFKVYLMIHPKDGPRKWREESLSRTQLDKLHADPKSLIEKVLESD